MATRFRRSAPGVALAQVVDLGAARVRQRFAGYQGRVELLLDGHRRALGRLFESGLVFTRHGCKAARELLRAQQMLLRASDLMAQDDPVRPACDLELLFKDIEALLEKTSAIARRHHTYFLGS